MISHRKPLINYLITKHCFAMLTSSDSRLLLSLRWNTRNERAKDRNFIFGMMVYCELILMLYRNKLSFKLTFLCGNNGDIDTIAGE